MELIEKQKRELQEQQVAFAEMTEQGEVLNAQIQRLGGQLQQIQAVRFEQLKAIQAKKTEISDAQAKLVAEPAVEEPNTNG